MSLVINLFAAAGHAFDRSFLHAGALFALGLCAGL
jgi:hypothetical protein